MIPAVSTIMWSNLKLRIQILLRLGIEPASSELPAGRSDHLVTEAHRTYTFCIGICVRNTLKSKMSTKKARVFNIICRYVNIISFNLSNHFRDKIFNIVHTII
uniref:Uncharacterized protein n=1 Tax=Cacopsylla melanoneura TaxID=428564 RepID=A0A8D8THJ1_9HEMI